MYTEGHEGRSRGIAAITKDAVSADRGVGVSASLQPRRSESRRTFFWDMPRRIAQERVPTASNVGSRDVTWAPHSLGKAGTLTGSRAVFGSKSALASSCRLR
jgi:hypothetical protein